MESPGDFELLVEDIRAERLDLVAQFFQAAQATLLALEWAPDAAALEKPELRLLLEYWHRLHVDQALPLAGRVSPFDMRPALGNIVIVDALDEGRNGKYRLFGSKVAQRLGSDLTGLHLSDIDQGSYLAQFACALHRAVFLRRQAIFVTHQPPAGVSATAWHWLVMPLADETGPAVARYLVGMMPATVRPSA
jgi:hypothetical protein